MVRAKPVRGFPVVASKERPWVGTAKYRGWIRRLREHARKDEKEDAMNLCQDPDGICSGDLGIPRKLMPQFTTPGEIRNFTRHLRTKFGIRSRQATRRAAVLRPSQEEIHRMRVEDVKEDIMAKKLDPNVPLVVSEDNYVIDGHHRWAAYKSHKPRKELPVLLVEAPARNVLGAAAAWGAKHHAF